MNSDKARTLFSQSGKVSASKANSIKPLLNYGPEFDVEFKVKFWKHLNVWTNILRISEANGYPRYPAVMIHRSTLEFTSIMKNGKLDVKYVGGVKIGHTYHIIVSQRFNDQNQLIYRVLIDGKEVHSTVNLETRSIDSAVLYLSDPWHASIKDIGEVSDVTIKSGKSLLTFQKFP